MKINLCLLVVIILNGCQVNEVTNIPKIIENADRLPIKSCIYEIEVDSINSIFDTVVERKIKENADSVKVFEEKKFLKEKKCFSKIISYYSDNRNLVYEKTELFDWKFISIFEAIEEDEIIKTGKSINYINNKIKDSTLLKYKYLYKGNKISKLFIDPVNKIEDNFKKIVTYDNLNRITMEYSLFQNDTISKKKKLYYNKKDFNSIFFDYKSKSKIYTKFDKEGKIISEELFTKAQSEYVSKSKIVYKINKDGNILIFEKKKWYFSKAPTARICPPIDSADLQSVPKTILKQMYKKLQNFDFETNI